MNNIFFNLDIDLALSRIFAGFTQGGHWSSTKISTDSVSKMRQPLPAIACRQIVLPQPLDQIKKSLKKPDFYRYCYFLSTLAKQSASESESKICAGETVDSLESAH